MIDVLLDSGPNLVGQDLRWQRVELNAGIAVLRDKLRRS
jgi:hypothetical protein